MGFVILDRDNEGAQMRTHMRHSMRSYRNQGGSPGAMMRNDGYEEGYKKGYEEGWKDCEEECGKGGDYRR
ncbi:MAG: hypothetical protein K6D91_05955 [Prevotella sp.]|nr:hypothetical protein [Prevotella sp.]